MRRVVTGSMVVAAAITASVALAGSGSIVPRDAILRSDTDRTRTNVGTFCVASEPAEDGSFGRLCEDTIPPTEAPRPRLEVRAGETIGLRLPDNPHARDEPDGIRASLARVTDEGPRYFGRVRVTGPDVAGARRFAVELPRDLRSANALYLFIRYWDDGDASYHAGLRSRG